MMAKKLDSYVKSGQFEKISNIPYQISRLKTEADSLREQIGNFKKQSSGSVKKPLDLGLHTELNNRLRYAEWMIG
jgi:hypothetical protein